MSFESSTPTDAKNFTVTAAGAPDPSCAGCLQESSGELHEHDCERLGAHFTTTLKSCPICLENLDVGPMYPAPVAQLLKKTKAANRVYVTFNYLTGLFVPVADGEFVLIRGGHLVPRSTYFESKGDFYEYYQDYYHCRSVKTGEAHIIEPALVERVDDGWKLRSMGVLEIVDSQFSFAAPPATRKPRVITPAPVHETTTVSRPVLASDRESTITRDEVEHPTIFSWALSPEPPETSVTGSKLNLIAIAVIGLLLITAGGFLLKALASQFGRSTDAQQATANLSPATDRAPKAEPAAVETRAKQNSPIDMAEGEIRALRERRIDASPSDRLSMLQLFASKEQQYADDYRFPYERAKLAIDSRETKSHHAAFDALILAAEEAIKCNKAEEMLEGLETDESGDFYKLAHGHHEWSQIIEALRRRDTTLLTSTHH